MKTGPRQQKVRGALLDAFRRAQEFAIVVADADLGVQFSDFLAVEGTTYSTAMFNLLDWVESKNKLVPLFKEAKRKAPGNPKLAAVAAALGVLEEQYNAVVGPDQPTFGEAESILFNEFDFEDAGNWFAGMARHRLAVCRIEPQPQTLDPFTLDGYGTGFLVAPDVVMTNYHVAEPFYGEFGTKKPADVRVRFDFETAADGKAINAGKEYELHPDGWRLAFSPVMKLDFALLRLAAPAADDVVAGGPREFLTPEEYSFTPDEGLVILQHPLGAPLKFALGPVAPPPWAADRVSYRVNTKPGSSGSPCFTQQRKVAALHHWDEVTRNRGVLMSSILKHLKGLPAGERERLSAAGLARLLA